MVLLEQPQTKTCFIRLKRLLLQKALVLNVLSLKELAELKHNHTSWLSIFLKKGGVSWNAEFKGRLSTESLLLLQQEQCITWKEQDEEVNNIFELNPDFLVPKNDLLRTA